MCSLTGGQVDWQFISGLVKMGVDRQDKSSSNTLPWSDSLEVFISATY